MPTTQLPTEVVLPATLSMRAYHFAKRAHAGQVHRDGKEAFEHPRRVAECFLPHVDEEVHAIAFLHDVLEDCPVTYATIYQLFGKRVARGVWAMTRMKSEPWSHYIRRVMSNPDAVRVKIADIEDNIARADAKFNAKMEMYVMTLVKLKTLNPSS